MSDGKIAEMPSVAVMRTVFGDTMVADVRDGLCLDSRHGVYDFPGRQIVVLLFSARSGSTFAAQLLSAHPSFGRVTDWFLPSRLNQLRSKAGTASDNAVVQSILSAQTRTAFGSKCIRQSLIAAAFLGVLDQFRDHIAFFVIDRRDKVAQAVSFHKARMSGRFHSGQSMTRQATDEDFDFDEIYRHYRRFNQISGEFERLLAALEHPLRRFYYEDFTRQPAAFIGSINAALDVPADTGTTVEARVRKLGDGINAQWCDRFREMLVLRGEA